MRFAAQQPGIAQFLTSGPDYGGILDLGMQARSKERQTGYKAEANIRVNALDAMAKIKAAKHEAKGIIAGGQAQASATQAQGLSSMFSNIAYGAARFKKPGNTTQGVSRTSPGLGIPGSVAPSYGGQQRPYFGPAY